MSDAAPASAVFDRRRADQLLLPAIAAFALPACTLIPQTYVRAAIVFPVALVLPGYAILLLAFGTDRRLDWVPGLSLCALLSMAFHPLAGLLLAAVSVAPSVQSVVGAVDALVLAALGVSILRIRRRREPARAPRWVPASPPRNEGEQGMSGRRMLVAVAVAIALAGLGLGWARHFEPRPVATPYTAFYLTGAWSHVSAAPAIRGGARLSVVVGVTNRTHRLQSYRLTPQVDGSLSWPTRTVTLLPGATWTGPVRGPMPGDPGLHELVVRLTMTPQDTPVGGLTIWARTKLPSR